MERARSCAAPKRRSPGSPSNNRTRVTFDHGEREVAPNELLFGVTATGEQIDDAFGGAGHYLAANCTVTGGSSAATLPCTS